MADFTPVENGPAATKSQLSSRQSVTSPAEAACSGPASKRSSTTSHCGTAQDRYANRAALRMWRKLDETGVCCPETNAGAVSTDNEKTPAGRVVPAASADTDTPAPGVNAAGAVNVVRTASSYKAALQRRAAGARRFRMPSVEDLMDLTAAPITVARVRASMPELLEESNINVNLNAYSSIGARAQDPLVRTIFTGSTDDCIRLSS